LPRKTDSNNPADWLLVAESDLEAVQVLSERRAAYSVCRSKLAEAVEKTLKAELIRQGWFLQKTHDLLKLAGELRSRRSDLLTDIEPLCTSLGQAYFSERYPGFDMEDEDWPDLRELLDRAGRLFDIVRARVNRTAPPS
jgi:HEPN domain-containing protein